MSVDQSQATVGEGDMPAHVKKLSEALSRIEAAGNPARLSPEEHAEFTKNSSIVQSWCNVDGLRELLALAVPQGQSLRDVADRACDLLDLGQAITPGSVLHGELRATLDGRSDEAPKTVAPGESDVAAMDERVRLQYEWLAPKLSTSERQALDVIFAATKQTR